ncbi:glycosyltransferase family 1 protein, partial [Pseudomonas aeruginosa]|nr:glycosyltransferase family 1 protein [Pseudomonas aeruginosa]
IGRPKGRFHEVLTRLDAQKMIRIYGPELIQGVAPWEGFQTYSGELPFDGSSMLEAINSCGVCLALSSKAHQNSGIMSNRL